MTETRDEKSGDMLSLESVSSGYGAVTVVRNVSFGIKAGGILSLLGKNGMGKTTLLKTILGLVSLRGGRVLLGGEDVSGWSPARLIDAGLSYGPQEVPLFQDLSIKDNLRLGVTSDRMFARASERAFDYFPFLRDRLGQKAGTLSGGEQKMLILTRALMRCPKVLLLDEISEGLQPSVIDRIVIALKKEREANGTTMLVVEQNLDFALKLADRWAMLKMGTIDDAGGIGAESKSRILEHLKI